MIVTVSGKPGSGKSTAARMLARELGYDFFSGGDFRGKIAQRHGLTIDELNEIGKKEIWTDKECDDLVREYGETRDNLVIDSWLAWFFIPRAKKIFLDVNPDVAAGRVFARQRQDERKVNAVQEMREMQQKRWEETAARYKKWYGADITDAGNYDVVIDTTGKTPEEAVRMMQEFLREKGAL